MKYEKYCTQIMVNIKGQLEPKDSFLALFIIYLPQAIAAIGLLCMGIAALILSLK